MQQQNKKEDEAIRRILDRIKGERVGLELKLKKLQARIDGIDYVLRVMEETSSDALGF
jgi:hypothetical protein